MFPAQPLPCDMQLHLDADPKSSVACYSADVWLVLTARSGCFHLYARHQMVWGVRCVSQAVKEVRGD